MTLSSGRVIAELSDRIERLEGRRNTSVILQVTGTDVAQGLVHVELPDGQPLSAHAQGTQLLPAVGEMVRIRLEGATPIYEPAGVAENAVTGREIAPGAVGESQLELPVATKLNNALDTANGSNRVVFSADPAPGSAQGGERTGDQWYQFDGVRLVAAWRWNGTGYVTYTLADAMFDTVSAAKITTGVLGVGVEITVGDPGGNRTTIDHDGGISQFSAGYDIPRVRLPGGAGGNTYFVVADPATGNALASIDDEGKISGQEVHVGQLFVGGEPFVPPTEQEDGPRGLIEYGAQYTNSPGTSSEVGVFEVAAELETGRMYCFETSHLAFTGQAGATARARIRMTSDGTTPTTSTITVMATLGGTVAAASDDGGTLRRMHTPSVNGLHRLLLTVARTGGTAGNVGLTGSQPFPIQMWISDVGPYRGNNAVTNDGGGTVSTPKQTFIKRYAATWSGSYNGANLDTFFGNEMKQGSYGGDWRGMAGFNSAQIMADTAGASIESCVLYLYANHWYYNSGGTAIIGTHTNSSRPATWTGVTQNRWQSSAWPKPGERRINLGKSVGDQFKAGTARGVALGPSSSTNLVYYGRFNGAGMANAPYLEIKFTR